MWCAKREAFCRITKVAAEHKTYESAAKSIDETLEKMGLDYLDMMIIHSPQPWVEVNQSEDRYVEGNRAACRLCFVYWSSSSFFIRFSLLYRYINRITNESVTILDKCSFYGFSCDIIKNACIKCLSGLPIWIG